MQSQQHTMSDLFAQLGLKDDRASIESFIRHHRPLPDDVELTDAPFWSPTQAAFLRAEHDKDADWVGPIDVLDVRLRRR
ncbi:MAG: DUF2789 domain-containing protein [Leptothrix sp. (in: b-proteobacteria)]